MTIEILHGSVGLFFGEVLSVRSRSASFFLLIRYVLILIGSLPFLSTVINVEWVMS